MNSRVCAQKSRHFLHIFSGIIPVSTIFVALIIMLGFLQTNSHPVRAAQGNVQLHVQTATAVRSLTIIGFNQNWQLKIWSGAFSQNTTTSIFVANWWWKSGLPIVVRIGYINGAAESAVYIMPLSAGAEDWHTLRFSYRLPSPTATRALTSSPVLYDRRKALAFASPKISDPEDPWQGGNTRDGQGHGVESTHNVGRHCATYVILTARHGNIPVNTGTPQQIDGNDDFFRYLSNGRSGYGIFGGNTNTIEQLAKNIREHPNVEGAEINRSDRALPGDVIFFDVYVRWDGSWVASHSAIFTDGVTNKGEQLLAYWNKEKYEVFSNEYVTVGRVRKDFREDYLVVRFKGKDIPRRVVNLSLPTNTATQANTRIPSTVVPTFQPPTRVSGTIAATPVTPTMISNPTFVPTTRDRGRLYWTQTIYNVGAEYGYREKFIFYLDKVYDVLLDQQKVSGIHQYELILTDAAENVITSTKGSINGRGILYTRLAAGWYHVYIVSAAGSNASFNMTIYQGFGWLGTGILQEAYTDVTLWQWTPNTGATHNFEIRSITGNFNFRVIVYDERGTLYSGSATNGVLNFTLTMGSGQHWLKLDFDGVGSYTAIRR